jgi:hypothetical protein
MLSISKKSPIVTTLVSRAGLTLFLIFPMCGDSSRSHWDLQPNQAQPWRPLKKNNSKIWITTYQYNTNIDATIVRAILQLQVNLSKWPGCRVMRLVGSNVNSSHDDVAIFALNQLNPLQAIFETQCLEHFIFRRKAS